MKKNIIKNILIVLLCAMTVVGCSNKKEDKKEPKPITEDSNKDKTGPTYPAVEPEFTLKKGKFRLRTDQSEEYRDYDLKVGDSVEPLNRVGYTFLGYKDKNGVRYIDKTGKLKREYNGTEKFVVLYPEFKANEYEVIICENNQPLDKFNKIICKYDGNIKEDLPIGRVIEPKDKYNQKKVVIGFTNKNGDIIDMTCSEVTLKQLASLSDCIDHKEKELILNISTSDLTYCAQNGLNRTITNKGYLEQKLDEKNTTYDMFDLSKTIDIEALKKLDYTKAEIKVSAVIDAKNKIACIKVMNHKAKRENDLNESLLGIKGLETKKTEKHKTYMLKEDVPIKKIKNNLYVYYNSNTFMSSEWNISGVTLEISFMK